MIAWQIIINQEILLFIFHSAHPFLQMTCLNVPLICKFALMFVFKGPLHQFSTSPCYVKIASSQINCIKYVRILDHLNLIFYWPLACIEQYACQQHPKTQQLVILVQAKESSMSNFLGVCVQIEIFVASRAGSSVSLKYLQQASISKVAFLASTQVYNGIQGVNRAFP